MILLTAHLLNKRAILNYVSKFQSRVMLIASDTSWWCMIYEIEPLPLKTNRNLLTQLINTPSVLVFLTTYHIFANEKRNRVLISTHQQQVLRAMAARFAKDTPAYIRNLITLYSIETISMQKSGFELAF
jgi:hypothetical protein